MKKVMLLLLVAMMGFTQSIFAQIMVTFENNTSTYFGASLIDNTWPIAAPVPGYYIDVVNNMTQDRYPNIQNGTYLTNVRNWAGLALRTVYTTPIYVVSNIALPSFPYTGTFTAGPVTYNIYCAVLSPTQLYVRIDP